MGTRRQRPARPRAQANPGPSETRAEFTGRSKAPAWRRHGGSPPPPRATLSATRQLHRLGRAPEERPRAAGGSVRLGGPAYAAALVGVPGGEVEAHMVSGGARARAPLPRPLGFGRRPVVRLALGGAARAPDARRIHPRAAAGRARLRRQDVQERSPPLGATCGASPKPARSGGADARRPPRQPGRARGEATRACSRRTSASTPTTRTWERAPIEASCRLRAIVRFWR